MPTLTSTGAVNLTSSTNWSPAQIPATGDDLIIGAHTLTLDADMTLNTITLNNANSRLAYSGTTRSVQATNGWFIGNGINLGNVMFTNTLTTGDSLTLTGTWSSNATNGNFGSSGIISATGGSLTLRTVGADPAAVLFANPPVTVSTRVITSSWSGGTLTTIGRFDLVGWAAAQTLVSMSGGTWSHQSTGTNFFGPGGHRICNMTGSATMNWTGGIDTQCNVANSGSFLLNSSSSSHTIGQSGDVFLFRNASTTTGAITSLVYLQAGVVELVGQFSGRNDCHFVYSFASGTARWRNQSRSIAATDSLLLHIVGGTLDLSGLVLSNAGKFCLIEYASGATTATAGTSITCTSTAATACAFGTTALDGRIVVLESSPATLPTNAQVAAGVNYGYSGAPQTGTGLIMDPATLATAMLTSFSSLPEVMTRTTIATLSSQTSFTLTAGSADDDVYNGLTAVITDQVTSAQKAVATISDYTGSTRTVTLSGAPGFTIATGDLITVIAGASGGGGGLDAAGVRAAVGLASANLDTQLAAIDDFIDTEVAAIKAKTDNLPADPADASDIASAFSTVNSTLATIAAYIDTEVAAIKAKTDNLPTDPADASDIAASFSSLATTLSTIAGYIDTEVAAIKAKTDNLPTDPADQSAVEAAITAAIGLTADAVWDEPMADHTTSTSYGGRIVRAANSNVTVQITGSNHVAADVHAFQADVIDADAVDATFVTLVQAGLATATELAKVPKSGETRRYTQVAADAGNKTADVSIGAPL